MITIAENSATVDFEEFSSHIQSSTGLSRIDFTGGCPGKWLADCNFCVTARGVVNAYLKLATFKTAQTGEKQ